MRKALQYAIDNDRASVTLVHKGNIMKFTEGGFRDQATPLAQNEFGAQPIDGGPWCKFKNPKTGREIIVKDSIADAFLQQILLRPAEYDVIATLNLERRLHLRRAGRASGRHRHCPGRQPVGFRGHVRSHPRHRAEVRGQGLREPRFRNPVGRNDAAPHGLTEAADLIIASMEKSILSKKVTYDFARLLEGATQVSCLGLRSGHDRQYVIAVRLQPHQPRNPRPYGVAGFAEWATAIRGRHDPARPIGM